MFEVGFSEMVLIGIVALIVLGPERLPKAARLAGLWIRRVRAYWFNMRAELERELAAEDMRKQLEEAKKSVQSVDADLRHISQTPATDETKPVDGDSHGDHPQ
jgi:sec-independent protein translocase protein TatB